MDEFCLTGFTLSKLKLSKYCDRTQFFTFFVALIFHYPSPLQGVVVCFILLGDSSTLSFIYVRAHSTCYTFFPSFVVLAALGGIHGTLLETFTSLAGNVHLICTFSSFQHAFVIVCKLLSAEKLNVKGD